MESDQMEEKSLQKQISEKTEDQIKEFSKQLSKTGASYYDCVKIKVYLNEHYYVFSRFMILRILTMCRISKLEANKMAKNIKKSFIDEGKYEIQQKELEEKIFAEMALRGYDSIYINRFKMTSEFFRKRTPFIIFICGAPKVGKSIIATYLAERLNISNMLQTSIVDMIMRSIDAKTFQGCNLFEEGIEKSEVLERYTQRCKMIQKGCMADVNKSLQEGKPVIIEGYDLMPSLFLKNENFVDENLKNNSKIDILQNYIKNDIQIKKKLQNLNDYNVTDLDKDEITLLDHIPSEDSTQPLIIPILLILNQRDLKFNIENSRDIQNIVDPLRKKQQIQEKLNLNLCIQDTLLQQAKLCTVIPVNFHNIEQTLDTIHDIFLEKLQMRYQSDLQ